MIPSRRTVLTAAAALAAAPSPALSAPVDPGEFIGNFAGWLDARRDFGAVGDGRADDTAALQRALSALVDAEGRAIALWLPAGTYRITRTLNLPRQAGRQAIGLNIQGEDPASTVIRWDGAAGDAMFLYGPWYSKIGRIALDGAGKAGVGLRHGPEFATGNEIADMIFRDVATGIEAGDWKAAGTAETSIQRCQFLRCSTAGMSALNFNTLDLWFWHCRFADCRLGLTNTFGAGNFHAYHCLFERSAEADISIRNTGYFSFRDNTSIDSKAFFVAKAVKAAALTTLQRNRIFNTADAAAVQVANLGPLVLLDNLIASRAGVGAPAVIGPVDTVSVGNRFTVQAPFVIRPGMIRLDDVSVPRAMLKPERPTMPPTPRRFQGRVVEIAEPVTAAAIQRAVDAAPRGGPVVIHLPAGVHGIDRTILIPPRLDVRLVGEGVPYQTRLEWRPAGAGPVVRLLGPSRASLRDVTLAAPATADALVIDGCDGPGARVFMDQVLAVGASEAGFLVEGLREGAVLLRDGGHASCKIGMRVVGGGEGQTSARTVILSGASSDNPLSYALEAGGRLLARDIWYETGSRRGFMRLDGGGEFTLNGSNIALVRHPAEPAVEAGRGFRGRATFLCVSFNRTGGDAAAAQVQVGGEAAGDLLLLGCHGHGEYLAPPAGRGRTVRAVSLQYADGGLARPIADIGAVDPVWLRAMLAGARDPTSGGDPSPAPPGVADVRLSRVFLRDCRRGLHIRA